jgi:hypothetical protein
MDGREAIQSTILEVSFFLKISLQNKWVAI